MANAKLTDFSNVSVFFLKKKRVDFVLLIREDITLLFIPMYAKN